MSSLIASRLQVELGTYPERDDPELGWAERVFERVRGGIDQYRRRGIRRFRRTVGDIAEIGASLRDQSDADLEHMCQALRVELIQNGITDPLAIRAFALVRELADRTLALRPYDEQIVGGWAMLNGMLAEMRTGEGKTLCAALPACTVALAGIPVHVITVNDYLAARDAKMLMPLYQSLGLSVGVIVEGMTLDARRDAYHSDVVYCTNKQLVFDYLRDRQAMGRRGGKLHLRLEALRDDPSGHGLLLRGLCYAIVDEADSVLIDEARTPLILSRQPTDDLRERGYVLAMAAARGLRRGDDYRVQRNAREVTLTESGKGKLARDAVAGVWAKAAWREDLVRQALVGIELYERDRHYLVRDGKVVIIDEHTGRVMPDRSWERGLHQMIELKEGCEISTPPETVGRISYQRFFRRYLHLAGMSGTAHEITSEAWSVYGLKVVRVPTHRPNRTNALPTRIYPNAEAKWNATVARIRELSDQGRPVLVGTRSVGSSEELSARLNDAGVENHVLNARQDQHEAAIIAEAGASGRVTVATNMAGRGTDIRLASSVDERGGLHVIATEGHDARRIDRQLFGRCGRQGNRGSFETIGSMDDELLADFYPPWLRRLCAGLSLGARPMSRWLGSGLLSIAQRSAERRHSKARRQLLKVDGQLEKTLAFSGQSE
ncbi:MAG: preprotein translocase subunit SecA [Pseudomonadota bacterium]